jgi:hypothetical protein
MAWSKISREDVFEGSDAPFISVTPSHFRFNSLFVRQAALDSSYRVTIFEDEHDRKLGFEFHKDQKPGSYALTSRKDKYGGLYCSNRGVIPKRPWLIATAKQPGKDRRFAPKKEAGKWVIQLCPAFEIQKARESEDLPSEHAGVYRYVRENGEIVYIGRGPIKERLRSPDRKDWDFDSIEYSLVSNPDQQVEWEHYWIERFKAEHNGKLPFYNRVSGSKHRPSEVGTNDLV